MYNQVKRKLYNFLAKHKSFLEPKSICSLSPDKTIVGEFCFDLDRGKDFFKLEHTVDFSQKN